MGVAERGAFDVLDAGVISLLERCRHALAVGAPEWEFDVESAMASDAALVRELDVILRHPA